MGVTVLGIQHNFYPRSPCGERRSSKTHDRHKTAISIHALLAESDVLRRRAYVQLKVFLSTLSLRRATTSEGVIDAGYTDFYPRSPCGERLPGVSKFQPPADISIHALLAESDR